MRAASSASESIAMSIGGFRLNGFFGSRRLGRLVQRHVDAARLKFVNVDARAENVREHDVHMDALQPRIDARFRIVVAKVGDSERTGDRSFDGAERELAAERVDGDACDRARAGLRVQAPHCDCEHEDEQGAQRQRRPFR